MKQIHFIYLFFLFPFLLNAQFTPASYQIQGKILKYQVMFPEGYSENKPYPLLVFLHGAGERGDDNEKQLTHGKQFLIDNFHSKFPAIVIAPQCPADDYWANVERHQIGDSYSFRFGATDQPTTSMQVLEELIRNWIKSGKVDKSKVYVGGLSMGGMGTLELLWRLPQTFAAAFPICGGADLNKLPLYSKNTSVWLFHGDADAIVPVESSQKAYKRLKQLGCDVKYTEYKGINHNSWDSVFVEKDLAAWLFSQKLNIRKNQK
jgi:predicted peptidase